MDEPEVDISSMLTQEEGLPRPQWDLIQAWIDAHCPPDEQHDAWVEVVRQWLTALRDGLGDVYETVESESFLGVTPARDGIGVPLLRFAEDCRSRLLGVLGPTADFQSPGQQVVIALRDHDDYYRYVSVYYGEGEHGSSGGMHIREGYPHVVLLGKNLAMLENPLAHELTHVALHHLDAPLWLEEGLAQMMEHDMTGRGTLHMNSSLAKQHKRYWSSHGLNAFWHGEGFGSSGKVQELSYQLAEILIRLLLEDAQPRWFGLVQEPRQRFFAFLQAARAADAGAEACRTHLGYQLGDLPARFLGPGSWSPGL